ncbi:hypothetical protein [Sinorhizobium meliloti]|uniref:hypothetical protein n=1 Tax=Rhizobium meliloti TaxID=382 RepID=UPI001F272538|nr:hypothetical protein [Sinorhizobium meliloti]
MVHFADASPNEVLKVPNWVRGEPLTHFQSDKVCIVEVLASWCKPYGITLPFDRESKGSNFRASSIRVTVCPEFRDLSERHDVHDLPFRKPPTRFAGWRETRDIPG